MDEFNRSLPTDGSVSSVGDGTYVSAKAGGLAPAGVSILSYLQEHGYCLCTLAAMSHGCKKEDSEVMLYINAGPLVMMTSKAVKVLASNYHNEVIRKYAYVGYHTRKITLPVMPLTVPVTLPIPVMSAALTGPVRPFILHFF